MKKILFVEDEAALQKALGDFLTQNGYKVINALDGEIGLRLAKSEKPDLILLDIALPKINGLEVLRFLRKEKETENIPVIILTNTKDIAKINEAVKLGAETYLVKTDYELEEVAQKVKKTLGI